MNKVSLVLMGLMTLALVAFMAPNVFAMNQGKLLRNIALWLAIFLGLALIYQNFGPGSKMPMFRMPEAFSRQHLTPSGTDTPQEPQKAPEQGL